MADDQRPDLDQYDGAVGACRPVQWTPETTGLSPEVLASLPHEPLIYPGSVVQVCGAGCGHDIYVGPRMQDMLRAGRLDLVACFSCAAGISKLHGGTQADLHSLGNPHRPPTQE